MYQYNVFSYTIYTLYFPLVYRFADNFPIIYIVVGKIIDYGL